MNEKTTHILSSIFSVLVGAIFLLSGYAKAADSAYFSNLLTYYGSSLMGWLALVIIPAEIALGWLLILQVRQRLVGIISAIFLLCVSLGFAYGIAFHGVYTCGCFGHLEMLNFGPVGTFIRNACLLTALLFIILKSPKLPLKSLQLPREGQWRDYKITLLILGLAAGGITTGITFGNSEVWITKNVKLAMKPLSESPLCEYVHTDYDSTYLVFAFSYSCPHCNRSLGNVALAARTGVVDHVIGLAVADSIEEKAFLSFYPLDMFPITNLPEEVMIELTNDDIPTTFWIRHDSIMLISRGEMIPPRILNGFTKHD